MLRDYPTRRIRATLNDNIRKEIHELLLERAVVYTVVHSSRSEEKCEHKRFLTHQQPRRVLQYGSKYRSCLVVDSFVSDGEWNLLEECCKRETSLDAHNEQALCSVLIACCLGKKEGIAT
jgi:hypothetical protein